MIFFNNETILYIGIFYLIPVILAIYCETKVKNIFRRYNRISSSTNIKACDFAKNLLSSAGIHNVSITKCNGYLTDHYNPKKKYVALSETVYNSSSVASLGVTAHEIGHVLQYKNNYFPIKVRQALYPVLNFANKFVWLFLIIGIIISIFVPTIINIGETFILIFIGIYGLSALFALITLPIEKNASKRALKLLTSTNTLNETELSQAKQVLDAAALTYVASLVTSLIYLLRFILIFKNYKD